MPAITDTQKEDLSGNYVEERDTESGSKTHGSAALLRNTLPSRPCGSHQQHSGRLIERGSCGPGPGTNVKSGGVEKWFTLDGWEEERFVLVGDVEIDK